MSKFYKGSGWNKWDLHIHTPLSYEQHYGGDNEHSWNLFINDLESLDPSYRVLGINDYFTIEGYKKLADLQKRNDILKGRILYPVIELRIKTFGSLHADDPWKRINLHVIFNNTDIALIENHFLNILPFEYNDYKRYGLNESLIEDLGQYILNRQPEGKRENLSARKIGLKNLNYDYRNIYELLNKSGLEYFIAIGKTEWDSMRWDGAAIEKMEVVDKCHFLFTSTADCHSYNKSKVRLIEQNINKPLLDCSDAHTFSYSCDSKNNLIKDRIGNSLTWIKADCTFEGLKQVCFEPDSRFLVSDQAPNTPVRKINGIKLNFPHNTKIAKKDGKIKGKENDFCLRGNIEISFSPYFTCLIGGRGSGKSTILNLIALKLGNNPLFFESNVLLCDSKPIDFNKYISVDTSSTEIEFISQNQIENYADSYELTEAIYDRLIQIYDYQDFKNIETEINLYTESIEAQIADINLRANQRLDLIKLRSISTDFTKIISSYDSPEYKTLTDAIKKLSEELLILKNTKTKYLNLIESLREIKNSALVEGVTNQYADLIQKITLSISSLLDEKNDFTDAEQQEQQLNAELFEYKQALDIYLNEQGVSKDDINDYERAVTNLPVINSKIDVITKSGLETNQRILDFNKNNLSGDILKKKFEGKILDALEPLNEQLKSSNSNVLDIRFEYMFDEESALNSLLDEFELHFKEYKPSEHATKTDSVRDYLLCVPPLEVDNYVDYMTALENKGSTPKAKAYIKNLFEKEDNFEIYKLLIKKVYNNPLNHKKIVGFYGGKELEECSFGQRCTAVIVALLMFGNRPLLIDEPEAHLDSKLVAEYLVDLIKKTKYKRQIIFATHNSNFVINGDAELVQILEVSENNQTTITSTSIENLAYREKLLFLEGGRNAFEVRDKKLIRH